MPDSKPGGEAERAGECLPGYWGTVAARQFAETRSPETLRRLAIEVGLPSFEVVCEGGRGANDQNTGIGFWLRFAKEDVKR